MDSSARPERSTDEGTSQSRGEPAARDDERARLPHTAWADVALRIRAARRALGLTQGALAEKVGVPLPVFARYESGHGDPSLILDALARVTGRPAEWFLGAPAPSGARRGAGTDVSGRIRSLMRTESEFLWRRNEVEARARALGEAEERHAAAATDLERREAAVRKREANLESIEELAAELRAARESLKGKVQELESERRALAEQAAAEAEDSLRAREEALRQRAEELERAEADVARRAAAATEAEEAVAAATRELADGRTAIVEAQAALDEHEATLAEREATLTSEAARLAAAEAERVDVADELQARAVGLRLGWEQLEREQAELWRRKAAADRREEALAATEARARELLADIARREAGETAYEAREAELTARRKDHERQLEERERAVAENERLQAEERRRLQAAFAEHARFVLAQAETRRAVDERVVEVARREAALDSRESELQTLEEKLERERGDLSLLRPIGSEDAAPPDRQLDEALLTTVASPRLASGEWRLDALGRIVDQRRTEFPERITEWEAYLAALAEHATPAGRVPAELSDIVVEVFGPLFE
jgi:DNA-binding XRE family transcriptional regulator